MWHINFIHFSNQKVSLNTYFSVGFKWIFCYLKIGFLLIFYNYILINLIEQTNATWHILSPSFMLLYGSYMNNAWLKWKPLFFMYTLSCFKPRRKVWDDKEEPTMHDEILEGNEPLHRLGVNLQGWAHPFILHNAITTQPWCEWNEPSYNPYFESYTMPLLNIVLLGYLC
jgi:hypothetical protein